MWKVNPYRQFIAMFKWIFSKYQRKKTYARTMKNLFAFLVWDVVWYEFTTYKCWRSCCSSYVLFFFFCIYFVWLCCFSHGRQRCVLSKQRKEHWHKIAKECWTMVYPCVLPLDIMYFAEHGSYKVATHIEKQ